MNDILAAAALRAVGELACIVGVTCAAVLAYADKSAWVWSWFLLFAAFNVVTGVTIKETTTKTSTSARPAVTDS